jgi:hypothetical protein
MGYLRYPPAPGAYEYGLQEDLSRIQQARQLAAQQMASACSMRDYFNGAFQADRMTRQEFQRLTHAGVANLEEYAYEPDSMFLKRRSFLERLREEIRGWHGNILREV